LGYTHPQEKRRSGFLLPAKDIPLFKALREASKSLGTAEVLVRYGSETGHISFTDGCVTWATVSTIPKTFNEYLAEQISMREEDVKHVAKYCKRTEKNFIDVVVEWGLVDEPTAKQLLLRYISGCLFEVFFWPQVESFFMPDSKAEQGILRFALLEVLRTVLDLDRDGKLSFHGMTPEQLLAEIDDTFDSQQSTDKLQGQVASKKSPAWKNRKLVMAATMVAVVFLTAVALSALFSGKLGEAPEAPAEDAGSPAEPAKPADPESQALPDLGKPPGNPPEVPAGNVANDSPGVPTGNAVNNPPGVPKESAASNPVFAGRIVAGVAGDGVGNIKVGSNPPGANIYLDGVFTGQKTPHVFREIPTGREHVILLDKAAFKPSSKKLKLEKGKDVSVDLKMRKGPKTSKGRVVVLVESDPKGAIVSINGKPFKQTTPVEVPLKAGGASKMEVKLSGYENWVRTVYPYPENDLMFYATLKKK
jgi:hypothetical protein